MKNLIKYIIVASLLFLAFGCGEERFVSEYTEYNPKRIEGNDGTLTYANFSSYPVLDEITSQAPTFEVDGVYKFRIDTIKNPSGSAFILANFVIDPETGVITYNNAGNTLTAGDFVITVGIQTVKGLAIYDDIVTMTIDGVPVVASADQDTVDVGSLQLGPIATVSFTDTSGSGLITDVAYELVGAPTVYSIDGMTGDISKNESADQGIVPLTVKVTTNLGIITVPDILVVRVGPSPTIQYFQQNGSTPLTKVTLSSWTAYTTTAPQVDGMTPTSWEIILPMELDPFAGSFMMLANGEVDLMGEAGLPEGDHLVGVRATNAGGISKDFPDVFTLSVDFRWEPFFEDSINSADANVPPQTAYPGVWAGYDISGASNRGGWQKVAGVGGGNFSGMRRWDPGDLDACLTRIVDITGVKAMRVNFGEVTGYGPAFTNRYAREFSYGESVANLAMATYDPMEWNSIMDDGGPWLGINWNMGTGPVNDYNGMEIDLTKISGTTMYLMWRLYSKDPAAGNQNGQFIIDYVTAERASIFPAEEG